MDLFIDLHIWLGYLLILMSVGAVHTPTLELSKQRLWFMRLFFVIVWIMGLEGLIIGFYRHPTSISVFQMVTVVGLIFASIGLLTLGGKMDGFKGKSRHYWYINGLGGCLISVTSASCFFSALQFQK